MIKRRQFIAGLGSAAAWPTMARAQQSVRRIGVLMDRVATDTIRQSWLAGCSTRRGLPNPNSSCR
jgi:hypothetical protein